MYLLSYYKCFWIFGFLAWSQIYRYLNWSDVEIFKFIYRKWNLPPENNYWIFIEEGFHLCWIPYCGNRKSLKILHEISIVFDIKCYSNEMNKKIKFRKVPRSLSSSSSASISRVCLWNIVYSENSVDFEVQAME